MVDDRCVHDFLPGQCGLCRPAAPGLTDRVTITEGGTVFHRSRWCEALMDGQSKAGRVGLEVHDPQVVPLEWVRYDRQPCEQCFADHTPEDSEAR